MSGTQMQVHLHQGEKVEVEFIPSKISSTRWMNINFADKDGFTNAQFTLFFDSLEEQRAFAVQLAKAAGLTPTDLAEIGSPLDHMTHDEQKLYAEQLLKHLNEEELMVEEKELCKESLDRVPSSSEESGEPTT